MREGSADSLASLNSELIPFAKLQAPRPPVKPFINLTLAGFVATSQNLTEVLSHLSFHVLLLAL